MRKLNSIARAMLSYRKISKSILVLGCVLCLLVTIGVFSALITPAVSQEGEEGTSSGNGTNSVINGVSGVETDNAQKFKPKVTNITVSYDENAGADQNREMTVDFELKYNIDTELLNGQNCITYNLNNDRDDSNATIVIPEGGLPSGYTYGYVKDGSRIVGLYKIKEDGTVYIWFTDDYIKEVEETSGTKEGTISFTANVRAPENNESDNIELDFGGTSNPVVISGYKYQNVTTDKAGKLNDDGTITWTITVNNPDGSDVSGLVVKDSMLGKADSYTVKNSNGDTIATSATADASSSGFVLGDGSNTAIKDNPIIIEYTTAVPEGNSELATQYINNKATLYKPDAETPLDDGSATVTVTPSVSIEKTGTVDYSNNTITWTVTINNPDGIDMTGYYLNDQKIKNVVGEIAATDSNGNSITLTRVNEWSDDWIIASESGAPVTGDKITVTYTTQTNENDASSFANSATVKDPVTGDSIPGAYVNLGKEFFSLGKTGTAESGNGVINWTVTFEDKSDNDGHDVTDVIITDEKLIEYLQNGGIITPTVYSINTYSNVNVGWAYVYDGDNIVGIKLEDSNGNTFDKNGDKVTINYSTPVDFENENEQGAVIETNKVTITVPEINYSKDAESSVTYWPRESIDKVANSATLSEDGKTINAKWTINVSGEVGEFKTFTITDTMSAKHDSTGLSHVWDGNKPVITYTKTDGSTGTIDATYVNVTENDDGTITISYDSTAIENALGANFLENINYVSVSYGTNIDVSEVDGINSGEKINISNTAEWAEKDIEDTATWDYEIKRSVNKSTWGTTVSEDNKTLTVPWTITIDCDKGAIDADFSFSDITELNLNGGSTTLKQQIDSSSFVITQNGTSNRQLEPSWYTITLNADGTGFEFAFTDAYPDEYSFYDITQLVIKYNTTTELDYDVVKSGDVIKYVNSATAFDTTVSASGEHTVIDPNAALNKESKYTFDENGLKVEDLEILEIDGVPCYMFGWTLKINENGAFKTGQQLGLDHTVATYPYLFTDTLPSGHKLYTGTNSGFECYGQWEAINWGKYKIGETAVHNNGNGTIGAVQTDGQVEFSVDYRWGDNSKNIFYIYYYTYIPVEEFEDLTADYETGELYDVVNTVESRDYSSSSTVPVVVPKEEPEPEPEEPKEEVIIKEGSQNEPTNNVPMPGYIYYSIEFNPDANDMLAGSDYITLTDRFNLGTPYIVDSQGNKYATTADLNVSLEEIVFYRIDENGNKVKLVPQPSYTFNTDYQETTEKTLVIEEAPDKNYYTGWGATGTKDYKIASVQNGSTITVKLTGSYIDGEYYSPNLVAAYCSNQYGNSMISDAQWRYGSYLEDEYLFTFTVNAQQAFLNADGTVDVYLATGYYASENWNDKDGNAHGYHLANFLSATSSLTTTTDALLTMQVPDSTHIVVDYVYKCVSDTKGLVFENTTNTVNTETKYGNYGDENTLKEFEAYDDSEATATSTSLYVSKVDASNNGLYLEAGFGLARWNSTVGWEFYTPNQDGTGTWSTLTVEGGLTKDNYLQYVPTAFTTKTTGKIAVKDLSSNYVYYLIETEWPEGYDNTYSEDRYFVYGTTANAVQKPTVDIFGNQIGTIEDLDEYKAGDTLIVRNRRNDLEIKVDKLWADSVDHSGDSVTVQLYSSTTAVTDGSSLPSQKTPVGDPVVLNASNGWTYSWTDLINLDDDGNLLFYYVEEVAIDTSGSGLTGYMPAYTNNGISENGTITVKNSRGLSLEKTWLDSYGKDISDSVSQTQITVKLYYSTILSATTPDVSEMVYVKDVTLKKSDGWKLDITGLATGDASGNIYYYYAVEETVDGYTVTYPLNGAKSDGTIKINNTQIQSDSTTLPSTGSSGNRIYLGTGLMLMMMAAAGFTYGKQRKASKVRK